MSDKKCPNMRHMADVPFIDRCVRWCALASYRVGRGVLCSFSLPHNREEEVLERTAKIIVYQDCDGGYRWRLRSAEGATVASSERGHNAKAWCAQEMERCNLQYPDVLVRDATIRRSEHRLLSQWLASPTA